MITRNSIIAYHFAQERKKVKSLSCVQLFATPWTVAYQAPLPMGFSRQEYWSGLLFPSPGDLPELGIETHDFHIALPSRPTGEVKKLNYKPL